MGVRFTFYGIEEAELARLAHARLNSPEVPVDLSWMELEPFDGVSAASVASLTLRDVARRSAGEASFIIEQLADRQAWPTLRTVQRGYKRWWLGAIAGALDETHRQTFRDELDELARLACTYPVNVPWFDALAAAHVERGMRSGPHLNAPVPDGDGHLLVELDPRRLRPLLEASAARFLPYATTFPSADWREEVGAFDAFVRQHIALLSDIPSTERLLVTL